MLEYLLNTARECNLGNIDDAIPNAEINLSISTILEIYPNLVNIAIYILVSIIIIHSISILALAILDILLVVVISR